MDITKLIGSLKAEGVWVDYQDGVKVKLMDPTTRRAQHAITSVLKLKEIQKMTDAGLDLDPKTEEGKAAQKAKMTELEGEMVGELMDMQARITACLIMDWSGFTVDGGIEVEFKSYLAKEMCLLDDGFKTFIESELNKMRVAGTEADEKNEEIKKK